MKITDAETKAGGRLKAATWRVHQDSWRSERILRRELQGAPVLSVFVGGLGRSSEDIMPPRYVSISAYSCY